VNPASSIYGYISGIGYHFGYPKYGDMTPLTLTLGDGINTRYVRIYADSVGSVLAYSEIEVYGK